MDCLQNSYQSRSELKLQEPESGKMVKMLGAGKCTKGLAYAKCIFYL